MFCLPAALVSLIQMFCYTCQCQQWEGSQRSAYSMNKNIIVSVCLRMNVNILQLRGQGLYKPSGRHK